MTVLLKKALLFFGLFIFCSTMLFLTPAGADESKKPVVVASTTQIADFARQVAGDQIQVHSILAPRG